jgi:glutamate formiminotransferase/glutamate formiminotransferase/formiminotetrahydrofolate cyclodeaminase
MPPIIECVPNFSEGRDPATVQALVTAVTATPGVWLLDHTMDGDHHRSVLTFAGHPEAVGDAAYRAIQVATDLIDLRRHEGEHPRIGATDVVPFIPIHGVTMEECAQLARRVGQRVGSELAIPVFLYEQAARDHRPLESIRLGGLQGLASRMESDPAWLPDFGPPRLHETAGATVIGARQPLIAFNVNLLTFDVSIAKAIANAIRHSNGGLPCLKAIGVTLASRGMVQVAMNLTDYRVTSLYAAFQAVKSQATTHGVEIAGSELVGLVPQAALDQTTAASLQFERFGSTQVLETRMRTFERNQSLSDFLEAVADATPTPGGGSVAALVGALAASLGVMGARLVQHAETERRLTQLSRRFHQLIQADIEAYDGLLKTSRRPGQHPNRPQAVSLALHQATEVPMEIAELACDAARAMYSARASAKPALRSDLTVGMILAIATAEAGLHTVATNMKLQANQELTNIFLPRITKVTGSLEELKGLCYTPPPNT